MGALRGWHIIVLLVVVLLLFGAPRLPELARSIGKSMNILKEETKALSSDGKPEDKAAKAAKADKGAKDSTSTRDEARDD